MRNVQSRPIDAPPETLGALMDALATPQDRLWPTPGWAPLVLDAGLRVGSRGGHGPIRYRVTEYEPGRRVRLAFDPGVGLDGYHEFLVTPDGPGRTRLTHTIDGVLRGPMIALWPLAVRWMHEALLQDLFDNAERAATGRLARPPARWSPWVRFLQAIARRRGDRRAAST